MNPRRGWNLDMEESYLLEYSKSEAETWTQCRSRIYLRPVKVSASDTSSLPRYSECTKTRCFSILWFFRPGVKLGFDFPGVLSNQNYQHWSLNFDFNERNPMPRSLKNSFSVKGPNFPQQKLKMLGIKFCFNRKMRP